MWVNDKNNVEDITNDVTKVNATNYGNLTYKVDELQLYLQTLMLNNFNHYKILGNSKSAWTSESWSTIDDGVLSEDSVNFIQNGKSLKFTGSEEGDGVHLVTTNIDMTETDDYWEVEDNDYITLWVYITSANLTNLGSATIDLEFYYEAIGNRNHYFSYDITPLLTDGFNFLKIKKTDFVETGTAFWQDIQGIGFIISTDDPTSEVTFSFDMLMMVSKIYKPFIIKAADEALNSSITLQQDNDFVTLLPPNGTFEIDLILAVDATSAIAPVMKQ